ncbi:4F2 cell-surface antigen heavy chain isoform X2 [Amia ocellicauda]|uniref:4F2 cell-surface antigen heavy chain isoform X2 n=1 Tax=Amia ocellicauda TaxID=2972642 RepID=UPI0034644563
MPLKVDSAPIYDRMPTRGEALCIGLEGSERVPLLIPVEHEQTYKLLDKEELERVAGGPRWRALRSRLVLLFWLCWLAMLCTVITIIVYSPRPQAPQLQWWQRTLFYQLQPMLFLDSNQDGVGVIQGISDRLPYLQSLGVGALIIGGLLPRRERTLPPTLTNINHTLGTMTQFQDLVTHGNAIGMKILLDLCNENLTDSSNSALQFWLQQGLAGFRICDTDAVYSEESLLEWRSMVKQFSTEGNERIMVWQVSADTVNSSMADLITRPLLPSVPHILSAQEVGTAIEMALQRPQGVWPSWTIRGPSVGHVASVVGGLHRLFAVLALTLPGTPIMHYGEELGLGQSQNASQAGLAPMNWGSNQNVGASRRSPAVSGSVTESSVEDQSLSQSSMLRLFRSLSNTRSREDALLFGNFTLLPPSNASSVASAPSPSPPILAFLRSWGCVHFLVLLNFGTGKEPLEPQWAFSLPPHGVFVASTGMDRLGVVSLERLRLRPQEAMVIKLLEAGSFS